jgi:predicted RNA-binding Zn-ribbon protein involved in translation (DUF1610 family)
VAKIQMEVIPKPPPNTMVVVELKLETPKYFLRDPYVVFRGEGNGKGDTDYICGCCRVTIVSGFNKGQIVNIVFRCPNCGSYNIVRGT